MKKYILFSIVPLLVVPLLSSAQIDLGVRAGANFSKFTGADTEPNQAFKPGFNFGVTAAKSIHPELDLQLSLIYSSRGSTFKQVTEAVPDFFENQESGKITQNLSYLVLPINARYYFSPKKIGFYAGAGTYFGYLTSAWNKIEGEEKTKIDFSDPDNSASRFDFGITALTGYQVSPKLALQLSLEKGVTSLSKGLPSGEQFQSNNLTISLSASYNLYRLHKK